MQYFGLPQEVVGFLKAGKQFVYDPSECEPGIVKLKKLGELKLDKVYVNSDQSPIQTWHAILMMRINRLICCGMISASEKHDGLNRAHHY